MTKSVVLADPRGFCAGVDRAILTVQTILKAAGGFRKADARGWTAPGICAPADRAQQACGRGLGRARRGVRPGIGGDSGCCCPSGYSGGVFRPMDVSPVVRRKRSRGMHMVDATCPLVGKVHREVLRFRREGVMKSSISGTRATMEGGPAWWGESRTCVLDRA